MSTSDRHPSGPTRPGPSPSPGPLRPRLTPSRGLGELLSALGDGLDARVPQDGSGVRVSGVSVDSRQVQPGDLYVAVPGATTHGAAFVGQAVAHGAAALLTDADGARLVGSGDVPVAVVPDPRMIMGDLAAELYGRPAERLTMIGVTGTNGKTTTTFLTEAVLRAGGRRVGVIGTIGFRLDGADLGGARTTVTTPESVDLHALLAVLVERGADSVVMEVSSHALALHRVDGVRFAVAGFTNLGEDHLDFHHDVESYFAAKALLFRPERTAAAVVNTDTPYGRRLVELIEAARPRVPLTTVSGRGDESTDWAVTGTVASPAGTTIRLSTPNGPRTVRLGLPGAFNVDNAVLALALVAAAGGDVDAGASGLGEAAVPGRMERVPLPPDAPEVVVDFAHTPQAVAAAVAALRVGLPAGGRLPVVVGSGGDRDHAKRAPIGAAAAGGADTVWVTDDNPRSEDPATVRAMVLAGAMAERDRRGAGHVVVHDAGGRRTAIAAALRAARSGDVVAILGKGHEQGQEIAGVVHPFDDAGVAREEWARSGPQTGVGEGDA